MSMPVAFPFPVIIITSPGQSAGGMSLLNLWFVMRRRNSLALEAARQNQVAVFVLGGADAFDCASQYSKISSGVPGSIFL